MKKAMFYILSALTLMFVGLKLADKIDWSWWWVFSPVWVPVVAYVLMTVMSQCYLIYQYKHNEQFRKTMDDYRSARKQAKMTLADRMNEMKEQALKMQEQAEKSKNKED